MPGTSQRQVADTVERVIRAAFPGKSASICHVYAIVGANVASVAFERNQKGVASLAAIDIGAGYHLRPSAATPSRRAPCIAMIAYSTLQSQVRAALQPTNSATGAPASDPLLPFALWQLPPGSGRSMASSGAAFSRLSPCSSQRESLPEQA